MDMYSKYIFMYLYGLSESDNHTFWFFNIAMENGPFIDDFPIKTSIYEGFSMAMLVITRGSSYHFCHGRSLTPSATHHRDRLRRRLNVDWTWSPNCTKVFCTGRWPFNAWKGKKKSPEMVLCVGMERPAYTYIVYMYIITYVCIYIHILYVYIKNIIHIYIYIYDICKIYIM